MKVSLRFCLFVFCVVALTSCNRDVYPKYLRMKQETIWLEKTCVEGLAKDTEYTYKGTGAYIKIRCSKSILPRTWIENVEMQLEKKGWQLKKREIDGSAYCLKNQGIEMAVIPVADEGLQVIGLRYPAGLCDAD